MKKSNEGMVKDRVAMTQALVAQCSKICEEYSSKTKKSRTVFKNEPKNKHHIVATLSQNMLEQSKILDQQNSYDYVASVVIALSDYLKEARSKVLLKNLNNACQSVGFISTIQDALRVKNAQDIREIGTLLTTRVGSIAGNGDEYVRWSRSFNDQKINECIQPAVENGDITFLKFLIRNGVQEGLNRTDNFLDPPLIIAIRKGDIGMVRLLLESGADVNLRSMRIYQQAGVYHQGDTPLIVACKQGNLELVRLLIEQGADVDNKVHEEAQRIVENPLLVACQENKVDLVRLLINSGANVNALGKYSSPGGVEVIDTPLVNAIRNKNLALAEILIANGANVNGFTREEEQAGLVCETPLMMACQLGDIATSSFLVLKGADVNKPSLIRAQGGYFVIPQTPIEYVIENQKIDLLAFLIAKGADLTGAFVFFNKSALQHACEKNSLDVVQMLIEKGVDVNQGDKGGVTPLMEACRCNGGININIVNLLIAKGANVNAASKEGLTPFLGACASQSVAVVELLIQKGAKIDVVGSEGHTPLMMACLRGDVKVAELLINNGAKVNTVDINGTTPLIYAGMSGDIKKVRLLIEKGATVNAVNKEQETLLSVSRRGGIDFYRNVMMLCLENYIKESERVIKNPTMAEAVKGKIVFTFGRTFGVGSDDESSISAAKAMLKVLQGGPAEALSSDHVELLRNDPTLNQFYTPAVKDGLIKEDASSRPAPGGGR